MRNRARPSGTSPSPMLPTLGDEVSVRCVPFGCGHSASVLLERDPRSSELAMHRAARSSCGQCYSRLPRFGLDGADLQAYDWAQVARDWPRHDITVPEGWREVADGAWERIEGICRLQITYSRRYGDDFLWITYHAEDPSGHTLEGCKRTGRARTFRGAAAAAEAAARTWSYVPNPPAEGVERGRRGSSSRLSVGRTISELPAASRTRPAHQSRPALERGSS